MPHVFGQPYLTKQCHARSRHGEVIATQSLREQLVEAYAVVPCDQSNNIFNPGA